VIVQIPRAAPLLAAGLLMAFSAPAALATPPSGTGNCVSRFTTVLGQAGVAGGVISFGAHDLAPFGHDVVKLEAHATLGSCPFNPEDFLPPPPAT
jgi:hypothetical protein